MESSQNRNTEGPCEGIVRRQPFAIQGKGPPQTLTLMVCWSWTSSLQNFEKKISTAYATQFMVSYGIPSQIRYHSPYSLYFLILSSMFSVMPWSLVTPLPYTQDILSYLTLNNATSSPRTWSSHHLVQEASHDHADGYVVLPDGVCSAVPLNPCVRLRYNDLIYVAHQSRNCLLLCPMYE